jgi:hypothetical protein
MSKKKTANKGPRVSTKEMEISGTYRVSQKLEVRTWTYTSRDGLASTSKFLAGTELFRAAYYWADSVTGRHYLVQLEGNYHDTGKLQVAGLKETIGWIAKTNYIPVDVPDNDVPDYFFIANEPNALGFPIAFHHRKTKAWDVKFYASRGMPR